MLDFQCPSCQAKCSVDDQFRGRKLRCPKCGTRIRHHLDGTIELLSVGEAPAAPAAAPSPVAWQAMSEAPKAETPPPPAPPTPAEVVPPPAAPAAVPTTGLVTKLTRKSESQQNTIITASVAAAIVLVIAAIGLLTKDLKLSAAALAIGFVAAYVALYVRSRRRRALAPPVPRPAPAPVKDDAPTEPLAKV